MANARKICIIGAGISGLAIARKLLWRGGDVTVLEKQNTVGGAMQSVRESGYLTENGPNSIMVNSAQVDDFLKDVPGLGKNIVEADPKASKRFVVRKGMARTVPSDPFTAFATTLWSPFAKFRVLREPFIRPVPEGTEESAAAFTRRRLGEELYQYAINPLIGGIYAGDPEKLSLRYGFPKLYALEQDYGSLIKGAMEKRKIVKRRGGPGYEKRMVSFKEGLGEMPKAIAEALGDRVKTGINLESIEKSDTEWKVSWTDGDRKATGTFNRIILAVPAHVLASLPLPDDVAADLKPLDEIEYPPLTVLHLGYPRSSVSHKLDGFGVLVPECEKRNILGVLFPSSLFPNRAPDGEVLLTCFLGGARQPELASGDIDRLMNLVAPDLRDFLGVNGQPVYLREVFWRRSIPQYLIGYGGKLELMETIEEKHPGLMLAGSYRNGISVNYCLESTAKYSAGSRAPFASR